MQRVRIVFFDAVGTLLRLRRSPAFHYCEVAGRHGAEIPLAVMDDAFRRAWKETPPPQATRVRRPDDDKGWWEALVTRVLDKCNAAEPPQFDRVAYFADLFEEFAKPGIWELFPETREVLTSLAGKFELGVISNFDGRLRAVLSELRIVAFFPHVVISSEVGSNKPDPWIFEEALRLSGMNASEAMHVGDDPVADWEGAAQAGMQVFQLNRPSRSLDDVLARLF